MTRRVYAVLAIAMGITLGMSLGARAEEPTYLAIENEFIRLIANRGPDEAGRFSVRTTGGDPSRPSSARQHLIFGGNAPWTSYTTVRIDGESHVFGGGTRRRAGQSAQYGVLTQPPTVAPGGDRITCVTSFDKVTVAQELRFMRGPSTRMLDTAGIRYTVTNDDVVPHEIGLRVMLDTMCGFNDGAPVRAGDRAISTATALTDDQVPDFWQAFDELTNPSVISQGTLRGDGVSAPSGVIFADWGTLADEPWIPRIDPEQTFIRKDEVDADTAVAMLWHPVLLDPGQSRTFSTAYGLGNVTLKAGQLALGLTAAAEAKYELERTQSFTITGYAQNAGGFVARDVTMTLTLPDGLAVVDGAPLTRTFPTLQPDAMAQASWLVRPTGKAHGNAELTLAVTSANIEANQASRPIRIDVPPPTIRITPEAQIVPLTTNGLPTIIPIQVVLSPAESFFGTRLTISFDPRVINTSKNMLSRGLAFVDANRLLADWTFDITQLDQGKLILSGRRIGMPLLTQAEVNVATIRFYAIAPGTSPITLHQAVLLDNDAGTTPVDVQAGTVEITPSP